MKEYITRIHLKTSADDRSELVNYCLFKDDKNQYLPLGWSCVFGPNSKEEIKTYEDYYNKVAEYRKNENKKINSAHNVFWYASEDDLFWTRDLDGFYWVCRAKGPAEIFCDKSMDIGAVIPVEAYKYGLDVPGQVKATFSSGFGSKGITKKIYDPSIVEFTKNAYNILSNTKTYDVEPLRGDLLDNIPDFDLEELVISYIQIKYDYYVLSNSIANNSTTIAIECEFRKRDVENPGKAIVQVKGGNTKMLNASWYKEFIDNGYKVFLYAPNYIKDYEGDFVYIERDEIIEFYNEYKAVLPSSISKWEDLLNIKNLI